MSAPQFHAINAIVFQLVATLEHYEEDVDELLADWPNTCRYDTVRKHMDNIQMFSSSVSCVAVPAVALLIAHSELMFKLWRAAPGSLPMNREVESARTAHQNCAAGLRRQCLRELSRTEHATLM